jgi:hypothetical protein
MSRSAVWSTVAVLVLATGGFAYTQRPTPVSAFAKPRAPDHVYGVPLPAGSGLGPHPYCTEYEYVPSAGGWRCAVIALDVDDVPIDHPTPYLGACSHIAVLDSRWACVGDSARVPQGAPPAPTVST